MHGRKKHQSVLFPLTQATCFGNADRIQAASSA